MFRRPPRPPLFPSPTLSRSDLLDAGRAHDGTDVGGFAPAVVVVRRGHRPATATPATAGGGVPLLVRAAGAVPDLQRGTVGRRRPGRVQALVGLRVDDVVGAGDGPLLGAGAVAVPELHPRAVGGGTGGDVHALAERADRAVGTHGPALGAGAVARPELDPGAVRGIGSGDVDALAADPGELAGTGEGRRARGHDAGAGCGGAQD